MKFVKLDGMKVMSADAFEVGDVTGAEIDTKTWDLTHLYVALTDEAATKLGHKKPLLGHITVCLCVKHVGTVGDVVTLNKELLEIEEISECK